MQQGRGPDLEEQMDRRDVNQLNCSSLVTTTAKIKTSYPLDHVDLAFESKSAVSGV